MTSLENIFEIGLEKDMNNMKIEEIITSINNKKIRLNA